jgi:hypothetical protein
MARRGSLASRYVTANTALGWAWMLAALWETTWLAVFYSDVIRRSHYEKEFKQYLLELQTPELSSRTDDAQIGTWKGIVGSVSASVGGISREHESGSGEPERWSGHVPSATYVKRVKS